MNTRLNDQELRDLELSVIPAAELARKKGALRSSEMPSISKLQKYHEKLFGIKFDQSCPACVADALRLIGNAYREIMESRMKEAQIPGPEIESQASEEPESSLEPASGEPEIPESVQPDPESPSDSKKEKAQGLIGKIGGILAGSREEDLV